MGLLDGDAGKPPSKWPRYVISGAVFLALLSGGIAYLLRYHTEKATLAMFLTTVSAGDLQKAYQIWKPNASYAYQDFLSDWGPAGEYGPVKSYRIGRAYRPSDGSGVIIDVELSRYSPFPPDSDFEKGRTNKEVLLWVERSNQSISFAPAIALRP